MSSSNIARLRWAAYTSSFARFVLLGYTNPIRLALVLADPNTGRSRNSGSAGMLLPGIEASAAVESTNPAVGAIEQSPGRLDQPGNSGGQVQFRPLSLGRTDVVAVPPPGFIVPVTGFATQNGRIAFHVTLPGWKTEPQPPLPKNSSRAMTLLLPENVRTFTTTVPITIRSSDPARLLVSPDSATPGSAAASMVLPAQSRYAGAFYNRALDNQGSVQLIITAPGFPIRTWMFL